MKKHNVLKSILLFFMILCTLLAVSCVKTEPADSASPSGSVSGETPPESGDTSKGDVPSNEKPDGPFSISLSDASGKAGEEITVSLNFKNNPSLAGYSVTVVYDPQVLTFVKCVNQVKGGFATSNSTVSGRVRVMCAVTGNTLSQNGECDVLTFKINEDAAAGESALQLILADSADATFIIAEDKTMPSVPCTLNGATVTVKE